MAQVLSLKELRTSSALKAEISKLQDEMARLQEQLERQKQVEKKLREDLLEQKKDYEHLEKQFVHFADIEADYEALQQEVQMERLEKLVDNGKEDTKSKALVQKAREELKAVSDELKELKKLDPQRLKRQVADLKKKSQQQNTDNQSLNTALVAARKELKEVSAEKETLEAELKASRNGTDFFWQSADSAWALYESAIVLKDEEVEAPDEYRRIRCMNTETGLSVLSRGRDDEDRALWLGEAEIPQDVSAEAGKRLLSLEAELEDE